MRRSFSTSNLAGDPKSVQAILGHAKLDMTANVYAQAEQSKISKLLEDRWVRLGLGTTKRVQ
jgi:integrase